MTAKEIVLDMVQQMQPDVTYEDILHKLELLATRAELHAARDDVEAGRLISQVQLEQESATWRSRSIGLSEPVKS